MADGGLAGTAKNCEMRWDATDDKLANYTQQHIAYNEYA